MIHKVVIPDNRVVSLSLKVPAKYVGKRIEIIAFSENEEKKARKALSPALPGDPLSIKEFKAWIAESESSPTISLDEAKKKWASKRKQLQSLIK